MVSGIMGVMPYKIRMLTAMMMLPMAINGRNLPNLPFVRSISAPMIGSVMASHRRMAVTMTEANRVPSASTLLPKVAM
jgi:hypothetical protein